MRKVYEVVKLFRLDENADADVSNAFFNILEGTIPEMNSVFVDMDTDNKWQLLDYRPVKSKDGMQKLVVTLKAIGHEQMPATGTRFIMDAADQAKNSAPAPLNLHAEQKKQIGFWGKIFGKK